ncbi:MAG: hypothetical protein U1D69_13935, partial [Polynucleobacter sp.]|nr:hypothetical protein [Polynucleobacter sp.]
MKQSSYRLAAIFALAVPLCAYAQNVPTPPPERSTIDNHNVDMTNGTLALFDIDLSIGVDGQQV